MTCEESIKWLDSLIKTLGQSQYQSLWNWEQPLTEIKEMLESKRVIELPCKVGDEVYVIKNNKIHTKDIVYYNKIHSRITEQNEEYWHCVDKDSISINVVTFYPENFGKTVFLTKSEAEQKLKELQND